MAQATAPTPTRDLSHAMDAALDSLGASGPLSRKRPRTSGAINGPDAPSPRSFTPLPWLPGADGETDTNADDATPRGIPPLHPRPSPSPLGFTPPLMTATDVVGYLSERSQSVAALRAQVETLERRTATQAALLTASEERNRGLIAQLEVARGRTTSIATTPSPPSPSPSDAAHRAREEESALRAEAQHAARRAELELAETRDELLRVRAAYTKAHQALSLTRSSPDQVGAAGVAARTGHGMDDDGDNDDDGGDDSDASRSGSGDDETKRQGGTTPTMWRRRYLKSRTRLRATETYAGELRTELTNLREELSTVTQSHQDLLDDMKNKRNPTMSHPVHGAGDDDSRAALEAVIAHQRREMRQRDADVEEARRLKQRWENAQLLREKLTAAEARAGRVDGLLAQVAEWEDRARRAEEERDAWRLAGRELMMVGVEDETRPGGRGEEGEGGTFSSITSTVASVTPTVLVASVRGSQEAATARFLARVEAQEEEVARSRKAEAAARAAAAAEEAQREALIVRVSKAEEAAETQMRRAEVAEKEITSLSNLVKTFEAEAKELAEPSTQALHEAQAQVAALQAQLADQKINIESEKKSRVLHMKVNPLSTAVERQLQERIQALEAERDAAWRANPDPHLNQLHVSPGGTTNTSMGDTTLAALAEAEKKVADLDKQKQRLQQVFKVRILALREACFALFGYRLDLSAAPPPGLAVTTRQQEPPSAPTTTITTASQVSTSMEDVTYVTILPAHADSRNAALLFRFRKPFRPQDLELIPTAYSVRHQADVDTFVNRFHSFAALTANLTMENFQKQKE